MPVEFCSTSDTVYPFCLPVPSLCLLPSYPVTPLWWFELADRYLTVGEGQELRICMILPQGLLWGWGCCSSDGLTGAGRFTSEMPHWHAYWLETSDFCHMDLDTELLGCTQDMAASFPWSERETESKRAKEGESARENESERMNEWPGQELKCLFFPFYT